MKKKATFSLSEKCIELLNRQAHEAWKSKSEYLEGLIFGDGFSDDKSIKKGLEAVQKEREDIILKDIPNAVKTVNESEEKLREIQEKARKKAGVKNPNIGQSEKNEFFNPYSKESQLGKKK